MSDLEDKLLFLDIEGAKALKEGIDKKSLYKDNTIEYTPTSDYNPAPKKYVDDATNAIPRIEVSETEPTEEKVHLWINPDGKDDISIPEIKDSEISTEDTWSSSKINEMINGAIGEFYEQTNELNEKLAQITDEKSSGGEPIEQTVATYNAFTFDENGYSNEKIAVLGRYKFSFRNAVYDGTSNACTIGVFEYDENDNQTASYDVINFWRTGKEQMGQTPYLKTAFFTDGGYTDYIEPNKNTSYLKIRCFVNSQGTALHERVPNDWTITEFVSGAKTVLKKSAIIESGVNACDLGIMPQNNINGYKLVSNNHFSVKNCTVREDVYLGKKDGVELTGWFLTGIGTASSAVSGTGLDSCSGKISVLPDTTYWKSNNTICNEFDEDDNWLKANNAESHTFTTHPNCKYVRISFISNNINAIQLLLGDKPKEYDIEKHGYEGISAENHSQITKALARESLDLSWMDEYIRGIAKEALAYINGNTHTSIMVTDTHPSRTTLRFMASVANMSKYVPAKYIVHCGDIINGITEPENEKDMLTEINRYAQEAICPVLYCKGNHDDNCIYARGGSASGAIGDFDKYLFNHDIYARTNAFVRDAKFVWGNLERMYGYIDDEATKIRTIIVNRFDNTEIKGADGKRTEDSRTATLMLDQWQFLGEKALRFADKENSSEWAVMVYAHTTNKLSRYDIGGLLCAFKSGTAYQNNSVPYTTDFTSQGAMEVIGIFNGDDHYDALIPLTFSGYYDEISVPCVVCLNASLARDNVNVPTSSNGVLMPPIKTYGTENETAFDIVTVNREEKRIYLTRYGARSYAYNAETGEFDKIVNRTRIVNYGTGEYVQLI